MKGIIPLVYIICYFSVCYSQNTQSIHGIVFKAKSGIRIGSISIKNTRSSALTQTNDHGEFKISVSLGDTLLLMSEGYTPDRITVENFKDKVIQLQPSNTLAEVVST